MSGLSIAPSIPTLYSDSSSYSCSSSSSSSSSSISSMSSESSSSTTELLKQFELPPVRYSIVLNCSDADREKTVNEVASFVSKTYATFLKLGAASRLELRKKEVWIKTEVGLPPGSECDKFEAGLKEKIVAALNKKDESYPVRVIQLFTDNFPKDKLFEVCETAFSKLDQLYGLFPEKTCTTILFNKEATQLKLDMNFKGPLI